MKPRKVRHLGQLSWLVWFAGSVTGSHPGTVMIMKMLMMMMIVMAMTMMMMTDDDDDGVDSL